MAGERDLAVWKDRYVFPSLVEGYMKGMGERFTAKTRARLKDAGLDVDKLPPAIPGLEMERFMRIIAEEGWPDEPWVEQLRMLGLCAIRGWQSTLLGKAASAMIRLVGPERAIMRLDRAFSTANNYSKATSELLGNNEALITINDVQDMPSYWVGILEASLEVLGRTGTITFVELRGLGATYRVKWE